MARPGQTSIGIRDSFGQVVIGVGTETEELGPHRAVFNARSVAHSRSIASSSAWRPSTAATRGHLPLVASSGVRVSSLAHLSRRTLMPALGLV